jgi:excisionase family DNA binding protein
MGPVDWMTLDDVKGYLGCSHTTVYKLVRQGELPRWHKIGGMTRWSRQEIDRHIMDKTREEISKYNSNTAKEKK